MKTIYIETLGCPKNACDSENAAGLLEQAGWRIAADPADASVILVNTCAFIDDAKRESIAAILEMAGYKGEGRLLVVSGCLPQRYGAQISRELPEVDVFIGVDAYDRLPEILAAAASAGGAGTLDGAVILGEPAARRGAGFGGTDAKVRGTAGSAGRRLGLDAKAPGTAALARKRLGPDYTAFVKIAEGCDNRCTYCVIPDIRGPFRSRGMEDILEECEGLAARGAKEIILIAQDLTAYGIDRYKEYLLPRLARQICGMDGIRWLRLMYCYEDRVTEELIETMAAEEKICHYIDLPLQHASDRILSAMRRRSDKAGILHTIGRLRAAMPDIHIRTTLITGFPGETKADFEELLEFAASARFERLGAFAYSREENTPAAAMEGQVRADVKRSRRDRLLRLQQGISLELNRAKIGREMEVLVEEREPDGSFSGRTRYDAPEIDNGVIFSADGADLKPGELVRVRINDAFDYDLAGEFIKSMEPQ